MTDEEQINSRENRTYAAMHRSHVGMQCKSSYAIRYK